MVRRSPGSDLLEQPRYTLIGYVALGVSHWFLDGLACCRVGHVSIKSSRKATVYHIGDDFEKSRSSRAPFSVSSITAGTLKAEITFLKNR